MVIKSSTCGSTGDGDFRCKQHILHILYISLNNAGTSVIVWYDMLEGIFPKETNVA